jgi:hypothetical protein
MNLCASQRWNGCFHAIGFSEGLLMSSPNPAAGTAPDLAVRGYSYEDRKAMLPALAAALAASGCWLHDRKAVSAEQMNYHFELPLHAAEELYSGLVECGLELTRDSHQELLGLCTLGRHHRRQQQPGRVIGVRLEVNFLVEVETLSVTPVGQA